MVDVVESALNALLSAREQLEGYERDATGESYNDTQINAAIDSLRASLLQAGAGGGVDEKALDEARKVYNASLLSDGGAFGATERIVKTYLAALAPSPSAEEPNKEDIARIVYSAMKWAAERAETGKPPEWVDRGNSLAQTQARWFASHITALYATPPAPPVTSVKVVARAIKEHLCAIDYPAKVDIFDPDEVGSAHLHIEGWFDPDDCARAVIASLTPAPTQGGGGAKLCQHAPTYDAGLCCGHPDDCTFIRPPAEREEPR
jgi:hypothetical protein